MGEARMAVAGLALSSGNYQVAVDTLKKRFGNQQEIVDIYTLHPIGQLGICHE